jgi:hypothetical protein
MTSQNTCIDDNGVRKACDFAAEAYAGSPLVAAFASEKYDLIETRLKRWCTQIDRLPDGTWSLVAFQAAFYNQFMRSDTPQADREMLDRWRAAVPASLAEPVAESAFWRARAAQARSEAQRSPNPAPIYKLVASRLARADQRLEESRELRLACPVWFEAKLQVELDAQSPQAEVEKTFNEAIAHFASYQQLYLLMAQEISTRGGGQIEALDRFALQATELYPSTEGHALYARIYSSKNLGCACAALAPVPGGTPDWLKLRASFEDWLNTYPNSLIVRNQFASFACRAGDAKTYLRIRDTIGKFIDASAWGAVTVPVCDERFVHDRVGIEGSRFVVSIKSETKKQPIEVPLVRQTNAKERGVG